MCVGNVGVALFLIWFSIACIEPSVVATIVPNNPSTLDTSYSTFCDQWHSKLRWIKQDEVAGQGKFLSPSFTSRDEIWSADVSVMADKPFNVQAAAIRIFNTPPVITELTLTPLAPVAGEDLLCSATTSDVDMDVLEVNYRWDGPDGFVRNEKVDADRLTPGLWICTATATDGDLESASMTDSIIVDENNESDESGARNDTGNDDTGDWKPFWTNCDLGKNDEYDQISSIFHTNRSVWWKKRQSR